MITQQDMEKVIAQVNSILANMHERIEALENEVVELKAPAKRTGRSRRLDSEATTN